MTAPAHNAELALLLEVAGTPKPGNVDRHRDLDDLRFDHFLAGAVGARPGLDLAASGAPIGPAFERAVEGMAAHGENSQFGALLLLVPLVRAAHDGRTVETVVEETTVSDAAAFYRAFDHVDVFVGDPPAELAPLDVRRGSAAIPALEDRGLTLYDVMDRSVPGDDVAREWLCGFDRSFAAADRLVAAEGPLPDRAATVFLSMLADRPDTLVAKRHGDAVAAEVTDRAGVLSERDALETDPAAVEAFADELVDRGINPGTTADLVAAGLFITLDHHGVSI